jgi:LysM repeat protein
MDRVLFVLFLLYVLCVAPPMAAGESQTWKVRPGDNLEVIAATLEIPKQEIKKHNPGVSESSLQIGQKLKLPLRSHPESKMLEEELSKRDAALKEELRKKDAAIGRLERNNSDLEKQITNTESQLRWQPVWFWGFWIFFGIIAFILCGAYWIFRQTHPQVFNQPHNRTIRDLRESQIRVRSSFPHEEEGRSSRADRWPPAAEPYRLDLRRHSRQLSLS